jgi:hypothetical protein
MEYVDLRARMIVKTDLDGLLANNLQFLGAEPRFPDLTVVGPADKVNHPVALASSLDEGLGGLTLYAGWESNVRVG